MAKNPAKLPVDATSPVDRSNPLNDPQFFKNEGYNNYELNQQHAITPRFGEVTPCFYCETVPDDRHVNMDTSLHILNQIDARLISEVNSYTNWIYTPLRTIFPFNYEKLITNPTKGDDLPDDAKPMIPFLKLIRCLLSSQDEQTIIDHNGDSILFAAADVNVGEDLNESLTPARKIFFINNLIYASYVLSRGSLMDYLGYQIDTLPSGFAYQYSKYKNELQQKIDAFWDSLATITSPWTTNEPETSTYLGFINGHEPSLSEDSPITLSGRSGEVPAKLRYIFSSTTFDMSSFRGALYDCIEAGLFIEIGAYHPDYPEDYLTIDLTAAADLLDFLTVKVLPDSYVVPKNTTIDYDTDHSYINGLRPLAYQVSVAEFYTNDQVDNIFTAELYMQNLRSLMYPSDGGLSSEPIFLFNGVQTEYDLCSPRAVSTAFFEGHFGNNYTRMCSYLSVVFGMRRSLRYGDYFSTGRPNLLAVGGQMSINVVDGKVDPLEVNSGLLMARYKNASNWIGSTFSNYMPSIFGVQPSDQGSKPYWFASRQIRLEKNVVDNTADDQGRQVTNLQGTSDNQGFDVYIDDFGVLLGFVSYDVLPLYPSGIDAHFSASDRFSMFNSMLQNVGDQPIMASELTGDPKTPDVPFAYVVRYAQYKMSTNRSHGAFVNKLPGYAMQYPALQLSDMDAAGRLVAKISPDFIRDKPLYFDQFFSQRTGMSPGDYYHFIVNVVNIHDAARKMQYTPTVL